MSELQVGDQVLTVKKGRLCYETVYTFLHREPDTKATFIGLHCQDGSCLRLTPEHFVFCNNSAVPAGTVKPGDTLQVVDDADSIRQVQVTHISQQEDVGIYAPATFSGKIVVNRILASCYIQYDQIKTHKAMHRVMAPLRWKAKMLGYDKQHDGLHTYCAVMSEKVYPVYRTLISL